MANSTIRFGAHTFSFEDLHQRDAIRWAVGERNGRRSATWRLWGDKKGDVYLSMRNLGNQLKVSMHRDRRCHIGFTSEYYEEAAKRFGVTTRHWERWSLPDEPVVRALQLVVPEADLDFFESDEKEPMRWIPPAKTGMANVFSVFIAEPSNAYNWRSPQENGHLLATMFGPSRSTWLVHTAQALDGETRRMLEAGRSQAYAMAAEKAPEIGPPNELRTVIWGQHQEKSDVFLVELNSNGLAKAGTREIAE